MRGFKGGPEDDRHMADIQKPQSSSGARCGSYCVRFES